MADLLLAVALLQPVYWEAKTHAWGGKQYQVMNQDGAAVEVCYWPDVEMVIVTPGYRGKWLKCYRAW